MAAAALDGGIESPTLSHDSILISLGHITTIKEDMITFGMLRAEWHLESSRNPLVVSGNIVVRMKLAFCR